MSNEIGAIPQTVAEILDPLKAELVGVQDRWDLYEQVFALDRVRVDLLNRVAGIFFGAAQRAMYIEVVLSLSRLMDPAESSPKRPGYRPNLTLERLVNAVEADDSQLGLAMRHDLENIHFLRDECFESVRNKEIAHSDLGTVRARFEGRPVRHWVSKPAIRTALQLSRELLSAAHQHYVGVPYSFPAFQGYPGKDGESLVRVLEEFAKRQDADLESRARVHRAILPAS